MPAVFGFASAAAVPCSYHISRPISTAPRVSRRPGTPAMSSTLPKRVLLPIATGSEEIETSTVADVLVRAGASVTVASVEQSATVTMSRGMLFTADALLAALPADAPPFDLIALPGGMPGAQRLRDCAALRAYLDAAAAPEHGGGTLVAAICAAPAVVLAPAGWLDGREATCYPAPQFREMVPKVGEGAVVESADGRLVTSQGPGTAMEFALTLVRRLYDEEARARVAKEMLVEV